VDEQITFRLPRALGRELARRARAEGVKRSHLARVALQEFLQPAESPRSKATVREPRRSPYAGRGTPPYAVALRRSAEGYSVSVPGLPGCWSQGGTEEEALANIREAIALYLEPLEEDVEVESGALLKEVTV